jgi:hypothetical protein
MVSGRWGGAGIFLLGMAFLNLQARALGSNAGPFPPPEAALPNAPTPQLGAGQSQPGQDESGQNKAGQDKAGQDESGQNKAGQSKAGQNRSAQKSSAQSKGAHQPPPQPKRILGVMPNFRAVSAGQLPPPPTPHQAFKIATQNSFDYSSFIFVGITSMLAEGTNTHPQLGKGIGGYWGYSWRGFTDKTDGNYWVIWALPSVLHEDERYYAKGEGGVLERGLYASTRVLITPNYHGHNTFNASEVLGRGIANAISLTYYPGKEQTFGTFAEKYAYAVGRDALTNTFREFWPDIAVHLLHRHP